MNIRSTQFDGLEALEITTSKARLVAITQFGPRIAFFGKPDGDNLLYWQQDDKGYGNWLLRGGHRIWVTRPKADEAEETYALDNSPCEVKVEGNSITLTGAQVPYLKIARGMRIQVMDDSTFAVTGFVTNQGPMLFSGGIWALTCSNPAGGKEYGIPLGERNGVWDANKYIIFRRWGGHTARVNDPQIAFNEEFIVIKPQGVESKRMVQTEPGIIALTWPAKGLSFIKRAPYDPGGDYPLGCNLAFYIGPDNFMMEMETCGEEKTVLPGQTLENTETWKLVDETFDWQDPNRVIQLMK